MSHKSETTGGVISLPQGGGAMRGIGEKFSPDLHTGTGNFTIPIAVPPGRNGLQPQLSLIYSTGSGNGPFGMGWSVSVPGVSRQTSRGTPLYDDAKDIFLLSGAEDLVPISSVSAGAARYRPRTERLFARIEHRHGPGDDYWEVRSADGLVSVYGAPGAAGNDPAVVADPARCLLDFADAEFACDTNESLPRARSLYMQALDLLNTSELKPPNIPGLPANPVVSSLKFRAEVNLAKLRSGRNIAGFKRQLEQMPSAGQSTGILPLIVGAGAFGASSARTLQPTPYRYSALIDRAKQLVTVAQQVEATYLATLEKHDLEAYNLFKATQDLGLAQANVQLQNLRVTEAAASVTLAQKQQDRATFQVQSFQKLLDTGMNVWERRLLADYKDAREARNWKLKLDAAVNIAEMINEAASGGFLGTGIGPGLASTAGAAWTTARL